MRTIKRFEGQAAQKGVKICNFCGFDSIPSDLGTLFATHYLQKKLGRWAGSQHCQNPHLSADAVGLGMVGSMAGSLRLAVLCIVQGLQQAEHSFQ